MNAQQVAEMLAGLLSDKVEEVRGPVKFAAEDFRVFGFVYKDEFYATPDKFHVAVIDLVDRIRHVFPERILFLPLERPAGLRCQFGESGGVRVRMAEAVDLERGEMKCQCDVLVVSAERNGSAEA